MWSYYKGRAAANQNIKQAFLGLIRKRNGRVVARGLRASRLAERLETRKEAQRATTTERLGLVALGLQSVALIKLEGTEMYS